jgi:hypothetical protein
VPPTPKNTEDHSDHLKPAKDKIYNKLMVSKDLPKAKKKKVFFQLVKEYHPDKSKGNTAQLFAYLNDQRSWFLQEACNL